MDVAAACVLDWIGVALAGSREPSPGIVLRTATTSPTAPCTVLGHPARADAATAALINGVAGHALDYDDTHADLESHATAPVLPAVLALAETRGSSGGEVLAAFTAGVELECEIGRAVNPDHYRAGWHSAGTVGVFGAAQACAVLLGLDDARRTAALGLAGAQAAGVKASFGTMAKHLQIGRAASAGLQSARWAAEGFTASDDVIGDPQGFAALYDGRSAELDGGSGALAGQIFKYHAACHSTHGPIEAVRAIMTEHGLAPGDVEEVEVFVSPPTLDVCTVIAPRTGLEAKFSLPATAAMAVLGIDTSDPASFSDAVATGPELQAMLARVAVVGAAELGDWSCRVVVTTRAGDGYFRDVTVGPELDAERLQAKFLRLAEPVIGDDAGRVVKLVEGLDELETITPLMRLLGGAR